MPDRPWPALAADQLLSLWEQGLSATRRQRDDLLLAASGQQPPPQGLGQRQVGLLSAHAGWFGAALALQSRCPGCGETLSWTVDTEAMAHALQAPPQAQARPLAHPDGQLQLRAPLVDDIERACGAGDAGFADALLAACVAHWAGNGARALSPPADWPPAVRQAALSELEALDPAASLSFALQCPACHQAWDAPLDMGESLWRGLQAAAEHLLHDIDRLARAYGWREPDILALSPLRRAAYLQLIEA